MESKSSSHHIHHHGDMNTTRLVWAVGINLALTFVQALGGLLSGSLSLLADALHNLSDAGSLAVALIARKVAHLPASSRMTFGYRRAEVIGALVNSTALLVVGLYLIWQSLIRAFEPQPVDGWTVVVIAALGLVVDVGTAFLTYKGSKESMNIRAAFVHNVSDALASLLVMVSGALILLFEVYWIDWIATLVISSYVIYHGVILIRDTMVILMQGAPKRLTVGEIKRDLESLGVLKEVHHIHLWQLDERRTFFEAHLVIDQASLEKMEQVKQKVREHLRTKYGISHSTLEIEVVP